MLSSCSSIVYIEILYIKRNEKLCFVFLGLLKQLVSQTPPKNMNVKVTPSCTINLWQVTYFI